MQTSPQNVGHALSLERTETQVGGLDRNAVGIAPEGSSRPYENKDRAGGSITLNSGKVFSMRHTYTGVIVRWVAAGGYGFIFNDEINRRVFFHIRDWHRATDPEIGDEVSFKLAAGKPGKPEVGVDVTPTGLNAFAQARKAVV
jgi:cold shock CspA family protein